MKSYWLRVLFVAVVAMVYGLIPTTHSGTNVFTVNVSRERWADLGKIGGARLGGERIDKGPFQSTVAPPSAKGTQQRKLMSTSAGPGVGARPGQHRQAAGARRPGPNCIAHGDLA